MTSSALHDEIRAALPDFALGTMPLGERARLQAHVAECAACQAEVAQLRTVMAGIGAATPETPPPALRARVLRHASGRHPEADPAGDAAPARGRWMPLALAASLLFAVLSGAYAWSLRSQLITANGQLADASDYVTRLRRELATTRRDSAELTRVMQILSSPQLLRVDLKGQTPETQAVGRAFWSASNGVLFRGEGMRPLEGGRVYQLWTIRGTTATSAGVMTPDANGVITHAAAASADPPDAFGVTIEPAGGSTSPTLPVVMLGRAN